ncbi:translation initiation factor IF-2 [Synechococcus sp. PCC 7336]|uniref:translation initiation factor IF-2 n=1 Tax=Synechococcus sp. PCC 7336 TaxID=195250 RepID=UPI00034DDA22|nr:translation initiation factor IF-2 [Synechococcus sp. PCC 7336]
MTQSSSHADPTSRHSAKVRIYDLSRELGRDNKDILDACDELGIVYKSHSSTISADDAVRIRERLGGAIAPSPRPNKPRKATTPQTKPPRQPERAPSGLQIVEVRKATSPSGTVSPPERPASPEHPSPIAPAAPSAKTAPPKAATPKSPTLAGPPPKPQEAKRAAKPLAAKPAAPKPEAQPPQAPAPTPAAKPTPPPVAKAPEVKPPTPAAPPTPPRRQVAKPLAQTERSVKPSRDDAARQSRDGDRSSKVAAKAKPAAPKKPQLVGAPTRPGVKAKIVQPARDRQTSAPAAPKKQLPELVGPPIRAKAVAAAAAAKAAGEQQDTEDIAAPVPELVAAPKRPPSRLTKRKPGAGSEDDEMAALKQPASRNTTKRKRRRGGGLASEDEGLEVDTELLSPAKQAELAALKPLPRPGAKPPSSGPRPTRTARQKTARPGRGRRDAKASKPVEPAVVEEVPTILELEGSLTVQELAARMKLPETEIIKVLFLKGVMANINQTLDVPTAEMVAVELGYEVEHKEIQAAATKTEMLDVEDIEHLLLRPPVVTIMGHVDHGKTTLLDSIRETKVAAGEAGGITQHIGAYHVDLTVEGEEKRVVFLDTPGHEAFTAMRARGTKVTDIAILVVAADDGVQPQTLEAISHAKAAEVPIVVAINKIDKEGANPDRVKQELAERGLVPEEWGGDIPMVGVSALAKQNLDELLEMLLLVAEVGELQANPDRPAKGTVIEANLDKARGPVATLLVQNGTLRVGDTLVAGSVMGRVKAMVDDRGDRVQEAGPSSAVEVLGMNDVPAAGDEFDVFAEDKQARQVAETRAAERRQSRLQQAMASRRVSLGSLSAQAQEGELKELNLILKADVQGSVEAILGSLEQLSQEEVQIRVLMAAPGEITETDIDLAAASSAIIVGFNTTLAPGSRAAADRYGVDIREYDIIYNLLEEITAAMEGLLEPEEVEEWLGRVEVRMLIQIGKGVVAGSYVQSGKVVRNSFVRVMRGGEQVYEGRIDSLKRFKEDVREVASGFECGIAIDKFNDWKEGDVMEVYQLVAKRRTLAAAK